VKDGPNVVVQESSDEFGFYYIAAIETGRRMPIFSGAPGGAELVGSPEELIALSRQVPSATTPAAGWLQAARRRPLQPEWPEVDRQYLRPAHSERVRAPAEQQTFRSASTNSVTRSQVHR
jgi:hypothetical protein